MARIRAVSFVLALSCGVVVGPSSSGVEAQSRNEPESADDAQDVHKKMRAVLSSYEQVRKALAQDAIKRAVKQAAALQGAAERAAASGDSDKPAFAKLAQAAKRLSASKPADADAVRKAFGEVSERLVALLAKHPEWRKGLSLFECPMAQGYKKWVQASDKLENPYMGKAMSSCGGESRW